MPVWRFVLKIQQSNLPKLNPPALTRGQQQRSDELIASYNHVRMGRTQSNTKLYSGLIDEMRAIDMKRKRKEKKSTQSENDGIYAFPLRV